MPYRIYLKWPDSRVSDKTVTGNPEVAEAAFRELLARSDLVGKLVVAVLSLDNRGLEYCRFDRPKGYRDSLKGPGDAIRLFHSSED